MAIISLSKTSIDVMADLVDGASLAVDGFCDQLISLGQMTALVNEEVYDLSVVRAEIQASTEIQVDKSSAIISFGVSIDVYASDVIRIDEDVEDLINERKEEFYEEYEYLKPDCEREWYEVFADWCSDVMEFIADNINVIISGIVLYIAVLAYLALVVTAVVLICTGAGAPVGAVLLGLAITFAIGAVVGVGGYFLSLGINYLFTGEFDFNIWELLAAAFCGGGSAVFTVFLSTIVGPYAAAIISNTAFAFLETLSGKCARNVFGGDDMPIVEIFELAFKNAAINAAVSALNPFNMIKIDVPFDLAAAVDISQILSKSNLLETLGSALFDNSVKIDIAIMEFLADKVIGAVASIGAMVSEIDVDVDADLDLDLDVDMDLDLEINSNSGIDFEFDLDIDFDFDFDFSVSVAA